MYSHNSFGLLKLLFSLKLYFELEKIFQLIKTSGQDQVCAYVLYSVLENRNWIHQPETLQKGHIAYLVKVRS